MAFVTPVVEHWLERKIAQWVHHMKDQSNDPSHHELHLAPSYIIDLVCSMFVIYKYQHVLTITCFHIVFFSFRGCGLKFIWLTITQPNF